MKTLKYILFCILLSFICMNSVYADSFEKFQINHENKIKTILAGYENGSMNIKAKENYEAFCNLDNLGKNNFSNSIAGKGIMLGNNELNLDNFCVGPIQGVFTTIGWIFYIIKIVVPVLLIIFGSIDLGKAVIASKDDEIKKSIQTLAIRVIAGIIIFFIPSILNLIVGLIDNSDVYKGTFWDCTKCMLDPNNNVCSGLTN